MDESIVMVPAPPVRARRAHFPWLAALVPLLGGGVLWAVTGSAYAMLFGLPPLAPLRAFVLTSGEKPSSKQPSSMKPSGEPA